MCGGPGDYSADNPSACPVLQSTLSIPEPLWCGHLSSVPPPPTVADQVAQAEIDALLDKVAEQGMDSLTRAERKALEEHSKRLRKRRGD